MSIFAKIYQQAQKNPKRIVFPEGEDLRVIKAVCSAVKAKLAHITLLGKSDIIFKKAKKNKLDISKIELIDPQKDKKLSDYIAAYWELRKHKGVNLERAKTLISQDVLYYAAMMLRQGRVDGFVAGAAHPTSNVARACLHCIERMPGHSTVSGAFLIEVKDRRYGEAGLFLFADCAIVPLPRAAQLADIAITSAKLWAKVIGRKPRLAMLSFSSKGSSSSGGIAKVREACEIVKGRKPNLTIDGELQIDSAIVPSVARLKVPRSPLGGRANILIFPNLDAGNIAYKLMQRLGQARVAGPLIQGLSRPCSDLSRGCNWQEILDVIAITSVRAQ